MGSISEAVSDIANKFSGTQIQDLCVRRYEIMKTCGGVHIVLLSTNINTRQLLVSHSKQPVRETSTHVITRLECVPD